MSLVLGWLFAIAAVGGPLPPLTEHVAGAHNTASAVTVARAQESVVSWTVHERVGALLPTLTVRAGAQINDPVVEVSLPDDKAVITPRNQLDGSVRVELPILAVGRWLDIASSQQQSKAQRLRTQELLLDVERQTARAYFGLLAAHAVAAAAARNASAAATQLVETERLVAAGNATAVDQQRDKNTRAQKEAIHADAIVRLASAQRALAVLSGLDTTGDPLVQDASTDDEAPVDAPSMTRIFAVEAAAADEALATWQARSSLAQLLPTVDAVAEARLTNAAGFGRADSYVFGAAATWRLGVGAAATAMRFDSSAALARAQSEQARQNAEQALADSIGDAESLRQAHIAARADVDFRQARLAQARAQQAVGVGVALDVTLASQEAFVAEVALIEADANLKLARVLVRLAAGAST